MRRKEREMDKEFGMDIIDKSRYGVLSMVDGDLPYGVPLSIARDENYLYFHSAKEGRKAKALRGNPNVSIAFVGEAEVPELYTKEELDEMAKDESKAIVFISSVFTTQFESAVVKGKVEIVEDEKERVRGIELICKKYTPTKMDYFNIGVKAGLGQADIYRVEIEQIKAKRKKYDIDGNEMKGTI